MHAIGFLSYDGPEVLEIFDLPDIHAGPGQVRIRNYAATVNPADIMIRTGMLSEQQIGIAPPYILGMEAAGVVDEVGEGVTTGVKVGDAVFASVNPRGDHGAYREQIVLSAQEARGGRDQRPSAMWKTADPWEHLPGHSVSIASPD